MRANTQRKQGGMRQEGWEWEGQNSGELGPTESESWPNSGDTYVVSCFASKVIHSMKLFEGWGGGFVCVPQFQGIVKSKGLWFCQKLLLKIRHLCTCNDLFYQAVIFLFGAEITLLGEKLTAACNLDGREYVS